MNVFRGHSGCSVLLLTKKNKIFVRKISKDVEYNSRLQLQYKKQKEFKSNFASVPKISRKGYIENLFYFDMEYIRGWGLSSYIETCSVDKIYNIVDFLLNIIGETKSVYKEYDNIFYIIHNKIKNIDIPPEYNTPIIKKSIDTLKRYEWDVFYISKSHGDLTFENILIDYSNGNYYLIDFLDVFLESWIADISKLHQDIIVGWSHYRRSKQITENVRVKMILLYKHFYSNFHIDKSQDIKHFLILDLLRIIPYIKEKNVFDFIEVSIDALLDIGDLYEYTDTAMCWPIYKISEHASKVDAHISRWKEINDRKGNRMS